MADVLTIFSVLVVTGRGAAILGRSYISAVQLSTTPRATNRVRRIIGTTTLANRLELWRTPMGAMVIKDLLVQSRDWFFYLRVVVVIGSLPLFLQVRELDPLRGWTTVQLLACFVAVLTIYSLIDTSPSPIGSEGERMRLWLLAPTSHADLLWVKLGVYLLPLLLQSMVMVALIGSWIGMPWTVRLEAFALTALMVAGPVTFLVWGSACDMDIDLALESGMPTTIHEHVPNTAQRLWLLNLSVLLVSVMALATWRLEPYQAVFVLGTTDLLIAVLTWKAAVRYLHRMI